MVSLLDLAEITGISAAFFTSQKTVLCFAILPMVLVWFCVQKTVSTTKTSLVRTSSWR